MSHKAASGAQDCTSSPAMTSRYHISQPNEPITICDGTVLIDDNGTKVERRARCALEWFPFPLVSIRVFDWMPSAFRHRSNATVLLPDSPTPARVEWTGASFGQDVPTQATGIIEGTDGKPTQTPDVIRFHLANLLSFPSTRGAISDATTRRSVIWEDSLSVLLDSVVRPDGPAIRDQADGTFVVTHVGEIRPTTPGGLAAHELDRLLHDLSLYLSFCRGAWCSPMLACGQLDSGMVVWQRWSPWRLSARRGSDSWLDVGSAAVLDTFAQFRQLREAAAWKQSVPMAICWYVEGNGSFEDMEGAIVLLQAALEMLAWSLFVEDQRTLSADGFDKLPASDKVRLLLSACRVPATVPASANMRSNGLSWADGPHAITQVRNWLVHGKPKNLQNVHNLSHEVVEEVWQLSLLYVELVLLWLLGYSGTYHNRFNKPEIGHRRPERTPWERGYMPASTAAPTLPAPP